MAKGDLLYKKLYMESSFDGFPQRTEVAWLTGNPQLTVSVYGHDIDTQKPNYSLVNMSSQQLGDLIDFLKEAFDYMVEHENA